MRWFKTPQEYLEGFDGYMWQDHDIIPGPPVCPKCGNSGHKKVDLITNPDWPRAPHRFRCKRWSCGHIWTTYECRQVQISAEDYVLLRIDRKYRAVHISGHLPGGTNVKGPGILDGVAVMGALSSNLEAAKDGAVLEALQVYGRHQQRQAQQGEFAQFEVEYHQALQLADEFFGISSRQALAERDQRMEEMREMGRVIAQEMVAEVRKQTARA